MSRNDDLKQATSYISRAEKLIQKSGFDPNKVVTETDIENLSPWDRGYYIYLVLSKLQLADISLDCEAFIPNPEDPDEYSSFKTNGTVLVVYGSGKPMWHMEKHGKEWKNYCLHISFSHIDDDGYRRPLMRLPSALKFLSELDKIDKEMEEHATIFPNPFNLDGDYCFKRNENFLVAYRGNSPVWYLKRENDEWKIHKMIISRDPINFSIGALLQDLANGPQDFDEVDEDWPDLQ